MSAVPDARLSDPTLRLGVWLLVLSAIAFSTAGLFTRVAAAGLWATIFWRNLSGSVILAAVLLSTARREGLGRLRFGLRDCGVVATASLGTLGYIAALKTTSVANVSIIYATSPIIAAGVAWLVRGERIAPRTLAAAAAALIGVAITVGGSFRGGHPIGDVLALLMTLSLSVMAVLMRGSALPASAASLASALLTAALVVPLGFADGSGFVLDARAAAWLVAFGVVTIGIGMPTYLGGAALVPSGRAMLISALEMPLAPAWTWLALGDRPATASLVGGAVVLVAVLSDLSAARR